MTTVEPSCNCIFFHRENRCVTRDHDNAVLYERVSMDKEQTGLKALSRPKPSLQRKPATEPKASRTQKRLEEAYHNQCRTDTNHSSSMSYGPAAASIERLEDHDASASPRSSQGDHRTRSPIGNGSSTMQHDGKVDADMRGAHSSLKRSPKEKKYGIAAALQPSKEEEVSILP